MPPRPCSASSGVSTVRRQSLVYWRPVVSAGVFTSILVAGLTITLGIFVRPTQANLEADSPSAEPGPPTLAQSGPSPSELIRSIGVTTGESTAVSAVAEREPDLDRDNSFATTDRFPSPPVCESYGTAVEFLSRPEEAARQARRQHKLLFLLHVSGNFEDAKFT